MQNMPILYSFRRCPYAMRARMAIAVSCVKVELREVALKSKPQELLAASPKATVPVLIKENGTVLEQSLDILDWALSNSDPDGWKRFSLGQLTGMAHLVEENDFSFKTHLDRYKYSDRHPNEPPEVYRQHCHQFLRSLEDRLEQSTYLFAESVSYADVAIFPFIRQFSKVDEKWFGTAPYPALRKWLAELVTSKLFLSVMKKHKPWRSESEVIVFPEAANPDSRPI
jgi:glutathione S-transferase